MTERKLSELQKDYRAFFLSKLSRYSVKSPADLKKDRKVEFFNEVKHDWAKFKLSKKKPNNVQTQSEKQPQNSNVNIVGEPERKIYKSEHEQSNHEFTRQTILSRPNSEQTDDLRILFTPNSNFVQEGKYEYPVVKMPRKNTRVKLPRTGRSNQKGYKENDFYNHLKLELSGIEIDNNFHMVIPNFSKPYEPDIVLYDKTLNLYIDIEIDEPYDGYYRYPTHFINPEDEVKHDNIRDLFFTESGWVVLRFTEKQVHCQTDDCVEYLKNVIDSLYDRPFTTDLKCVSESQWNYNQCIQLQKIYYREKYLGIERFQKQYSYKEIKVDIEESESIESVIERTKMVNISKWDSSIAFDEESHKYLHPKDETGNAEYISVTTLIERFFPFDLKRYVERKAEEENKSEEEVLDEYLFMRDEAAEKGTYLHSQIENFLKKNKYESDTKEFGLFLDFYRREIETRNLTFFDAEKMIISNKYELAGTIDCLFKKGEKDEYVMLDWKRSKKLIIDGRPRIFGYGYALLELGALDNSSFNRYCLQQNLYKHIAETEYLMKISSMKLVVLHENYPDYYVVDVPIMTKETSIILNSLKLKI